MTDKAHEYVATLRAGYSAEDDATAMMIAHAMATKITDEMLDADEGDEVIVTQVIDYNLPDTTAEIRLVLAKARNVLIRTRIASMIDVAKEVDKVIFALDHGDYQSMMPYDHGRFMDIMEKTLNGENPVDA